MSIGEESAFPSHIKMPSSTFVSGRVDLGMTYRQWLIGKLLEGAAPALIRYCKDEGLDSDFMGTECSQMQSMAFHIADAVLAAMDEEKGEGK